MYYIYLKELTHYFNSLVAYLIIGSFLLITGLFTWVFPDTSILKYGYSTLESLFNLGPYLFLILIPSLTMRTISEEKSTGTLELLLTTPVNLVKVLLAKFLAVVTITILAILPTLVYFYSVYQLGNPIGNVDSGSVIGSYCGLVLLAISFCSIGLFSSTVSSNQIVSFLVSISICYFLYDGLYYVSKLSTFSISLSYFFEIISMQSHYYLLDTYCLTIVLEQ